MAETFKVVLDGTHDIRNQIEEIRRPIGRAASHAIGEAAGLAKDRLRSQVRSRFRHRMRGNSHFANSFNAYVYNGPHRGKEFVYEPAVDIQANASWADVFEEGSGIGPKRAQSLLIPTETAEELGLDRDPLSDRYRGRESQGELAKRLFGETFVFQKGGKAFIAASEGDELRVLFRLKRRVRMPKKLSFYDTVRWAARQLPAQFDEGMRIHS